MKKQLGVLVLSLALLFAFTVTATKTKQAKVLEVYDGDTIYVFHHDGILF